MFHFLSRNEPHRPRGFLSLGLPATLVAAWICVSVTLADTVNLRGGRQVEGEVVSLDAEELVIRTADGLQRLPRSDVRSIEFLTGEPIPPPLKVEVRNVRSDDSIDLLLDDEVVIQDAREGGRWIDLTPKLKNGNNPLRLRIRNDRGTWAYRWHLRINGRVTSMSCGVPYDRNNPCTCCGKTGLEKGVIDDLPIVWIFVDRESGRADVVP